MNRIDNVNKYIDVLASKLFGASLFMITELDVDDREATVFSDEAIEEILDTDRVLLQHPGHAAALRKSGDGRWFLFDANFERALTVPKDALVRFLK